MYERSGLRLRVPRPFAFRRRFRAGRRRPREFPPRRSGPLRLPPPAHVDDPVSRLDHVEIVLDHDDRVPLLDETVEHFEQLVDVVEVQAGRRLIENVEGLARVGACQLGGQLDPLGFAARKRRCGLAEREIIETDRAQRRQIAADAGNVLEQLVVPARSAFPARRRSNGRDKSRPAFRGYSACRGTFRTRPTRRAESASECTSGRSPRSRRSGPPGD